jgi:hypothetical protein
MGIDLSRDQGRIAQLRELASVRPLSFAVWKLYSEHGFPPGWTDPHSTYLLDGRYRITLTRQFYTPHSSVWHLSISSAGFAPVADAVVDDIAAACGLTDFRKHVVDLGQNRKQTQVLQPVEQGWRHFDGVYGGGRNPRQRVSRPVH